VPVKFFGVYAVKTIAWFLRVARSCCIKGRVVGPRCPGPAGYATGECGGGTRLLKWDTWELVLRIMGGESA